MVFRIYNVVDQTGKIVKIGSTIRTLARRSTQNPYNNKKYKNCRLTLRREFECDDRDFGLILLRVREQFEISRAHLWEKGWNETEPVRDLLRNMCERTSSVLGGKISGRKNVENGHWFKITSSGAGGKTGAGGKANVLSGHIQKLGLKYGPIRGRKNVENGSITALGLKNAKTLGYMSNCGKIGGTVSGPKNAAMMNISGAAKKGLHNRWHVSRGILNLNCCLCYPQEKSA